MAGSGTRAIVLGTAQDGGFPQPGCKLPCCQRARSIAGISRTPVALGIVGSDGTSHIIEVGRHIGEHFEIWDKAVGFEWPLSSASLTHAHLGHTDGLRLLGREAIGGHGIILHCSKSMLSLINENPTWRIMVEQGVLVPKKWESMTPFEPTPGCGFTITPVPVIHRAELSDNHAIIVSGCDSRLLFMPDQDSWEATLEGATIREWLTYLDVDYALIDGTFWDSSELPGRDMSEIPHPTVCESIELLGNRGSEDPDIAFFHLNHTNPLNDKSSEEFLTIGRMGWRVSEPGEVYNLG